MKQIIFKPKASEQYRQWAFDNRKIFEKICSLIEEVVSNPFEGTGKPEPLKHELAGCWSRRITKKDRFVYQVTDDAIIIISCKYHYS